MCVSILPECMSVCCLHAWSCGGQKRAFYLLNLETVVSYPRMLGTEPGSSARATVAPHSEETVNKAAKLKDGVARMHPFIRFL